MIFFYKKGVKNLKSNIYINEDLGLNNCYGSNQYNKQSTIMQNSLHITFFVAVFDSYIFVYFRYNLSINCRITSIYASITQYVSSVNTYIEINKVTQQILVKLIAFICHTYEFFNIVFKNVYKNLNLFEFEKIYTFQITSEKNMVDFVYFTTLSNVHFIAIVLNAQYANLKTRSN